MNPFWLEVENPFGFHVEPFSTEGSTWNPKGFYLEPKRVILCGQSKNPFGTLFPKRVELHEL